MAEKSIELAKRLVALDKDRKHCPFCKRNWGAENHADNCPFSMAYDIILDEPLPEKNKIPLRWVEIFEGIDKYATATRRTWDSTTYLKLQTLVDGEWRDVEIEHNPGGEGG